MPKIVLLTNDFSPMVGGIADFLQNICRLVGRDVVVQTIQMPNADSFDQSQAYSIYRHDVEMTSLYQRNVILPWRWIHKSHQLISHDNSAIYLGGYTSRIILTTLLYLKARYRVKIAVVVHGGDVRALLLQSTWIRRIYMFLLRYIDLFIANSQFTADLIHRELCISTDKLHVLNPGIHLPDAMPFVESGNTNQLPKNSGNTLLTVARLVEHKGIDNVIRAVRVLIDRGIEINYAIVGRGPDKERLKGLVSSLALEKYVNFAGFVPDDELQDYFQHSSIFIMPSREMADGSVEGFGIVFLEAAAYGLPVIGSYSGGISDAVIDGQTGLLVNPNDVDQIAAAIMRLLSNQKLAVEMGKAGQQRVQDKFDWNKRIKEVRQILT
ncbi:MAG: glycosyltransferase family 4 protein [Chloroflexota bacterium]